MNLLSYSVLLVLWGCSRAQVPCGRPENREKEEPAVALVAQYSDQTVLTYNCQPGYRKLGRIQYKCNNGEWKRIGEVQCTEKPCGHPGDIESGTFHITQATEFVFGARVEYKCDDGYQMISRLNYRDCTATGWSNSVPFCEPKKCVPFLAPYGGRIIATGTHQVDDEASVGHVLRFECNSPTAKPVPKEVFCTQEGEWSSARVECIEITCPRPVIEHGIIRNPNTVFKKDERLNFECDTGYKPEESRRAPECTENGWNPDPACKAILCLSEIVDHGEIIPKKDSYKEGEIVELRCQAGFEAKSVEIARPKCEASGWVPPLICESKACDYIKIENGKYYSPKYNQYPSYYFPMPNGKLIYYNCNEGFAPLSGEYYGKMTCTSSGWSPAPKCLRTCERSYFSDMEIYYERSVYLVGTTASYKCQTGFTNQEGNERGTLECLPSGQFSEPKCTRSCIIPSTSLKSYKPNKKVFYVNERLQYDCEDGFKSQKNNLVGKAECAPNGWTETPQCKEITCSLSQADSRRYHLSTRLGTFKDGYVMKFECQKGYKTNGAEKAQCYYFGWYPEPPRCEEESEPDSSNGGGADAAMDSGEECPQAPVLANTEEENIRHAYYNDDTVTYKCKTNYILYGSNTITCQKGQWTSPPQCIEREQCSPPPFTSNGEIFRLGSSTTFYSGDLVTYRCKAGYRLMGSNESMCIGGRWPTAPICSASPCDQAPSIEFGSVENYRSSYAHGSTVQIRCDSGYKLSPQSEPICSRGQWLSVPRCTSTACGAAPRVQNAKIRDSERQSYPSGETVNYQCDSGFDFETVSYASCSSGQWINLPVCQKIGERCGPAPPLDNGDVVGNQQPYYNSGSFVTYKCQDYHLMEREPIVTCRNGAWTALPYCLEPCTASEEEMAANNLQLRYKADKKLYSKHGDTIEFMCIKDHMKVETLEFRVKCNRGKLLYPKCIKYGSCVASTSEMDAKNIFLQRENVDIANRESVVFTCKLGFFQKTNQNMKVTCEFGKLDYPECGSTPPDCSGPPSIKHGSVLGVPKAVYPPGSIAEYTCDDNYALEGTRRLTCIGRGWSGDAPECIGPCQLSKAEMNRNNLELYSVDSINKPVKHKTSIDFKCKEGFVGQPSGECDKGIFRYPSCIVDSPCQVTAEKQEEHGVDLKRKPRDSLFFTDGAIMEFTCKSGFKTLTPKSLIVKCTAEGFEYPTCNSTEPCRLTQEDMDGNNLELHEKHNGETKYLNGQTIDFKCKSGFFAKPQLSGVCSRRKITYPTCAPAHSCILSQDKMTENSIELLLDDENRRYVENSVQVSFRCKKGFEKHPGSGDLTQECVGGVVAYPSCIPRGTPV